MGLTLLAQDLPLDHYDKVSPCPITWCLVASATAITLLSYYRCQRLLGTKGVALSGVVVVFALQLDVPGPATLDDTSCGDYRSKEHSTWLRMAIWLLRLCLHVLAGHSSIGEKTTDVLNESAMHKRQTLFSIINDNLPDGTTSHALLLIRRRACSLHGTSDVNVRPVQSCW